MLAIIIAAFMAASAPSPLEMARDKQDRAALTELAVQAGASAQRDNQHTTIPLHKSILGRLFLCRGLGPSVEHRLEFLQAV